MATAPDIAIELSRRRLRAVHADWSRGKLRIRKALSEHLPDDLDAGDPRTVGAWMGRRLHQDGLPRERATFALPREFVALKRLTLPTTNDVELPDMTRLAMQRELPFDPATAVIDFMPVRRTESGTSVIAVAVQEESVEYTRTLAKAAGLGIASISLRGMGAAALIGAMHPAAEQRDKRILLVDVTADVVDFSIIEDGSIRFSRAAEIEPDEASDEYADAVLREIRRTWMSYRIVDDDSRVDAAVLLGDECVSADSVRSLSEMLSVRAELLERHLQVDDGGVSLRGLWPLAGLLLAPNIDAPSIDFVHPRKAPDVGARRRQLALAGAGAAVIALFGGWTVASRTIADLERRLEDAQSKMRDLAPGYQRYGRDLYKLEHLAQWESTRVNWLEHAAVLQELAPPPGRIVLDEWSGRVDFRGVEYDHRERAWSAPTRISITLEGEATDRRTADAFRAALVESNLYTVSSGGTDAEGGKRLPFGFTYRLSTDEALPARDDAPRDEPGSDEAVTAARGEANEERSG